MMIACIMRVLVLLYFRMMVWNALCFREVNSGNAGYLSSVGSVHMVGALLHNQ